MPSVLEIYRQSKKKRDNFWTEWVSRPPAAALVWVLAKTPITPNQVSFLAIAIAAGACATLVAWRDWTGLLVGGAGLQLAYIVDCADGQLARLTGRTSPAGALLDFMLDEVKAFLVIGAATVRLYLQTTDARWLLFGIGGLFAAATGITLTSFMRRPEYRQATGAPELPPSTERSDHAPRSLHPVALVEALGRVVLHYPTWFLVICAVNRLDLFVYIYLGAHALYLGRSALIVLFKLGKFS